MAHRNLFLNSAYVRAPLLNGLGRYVCQLQRITVKYCKEHADSKGVRDFITDYAVDFAKKNPGTVVYLKPRRHRAPHIKLEYLNGETEIMEAKCMAAREVAQWLEVARGCSGIPVARLRKFQHTDHPSIQGVWTPWTNVPPETNLETFPSDKYRAPERGQSATERLREIFQQQQQQMQQQTADGPETLAAGENVRPAGS